MQDFYLGWGTWWSSQAIAKCIMVAQGWWPWYYHKFGGVSENGMAMLTLGMVPAKRCIRSTWIIWRKWVDWKAMCLTRKRSRLSYRCLTSFWFNLRSGWTTLAKVIALHTVPTTIDWKISSAGWWINFRRSDFPCNYLYHHPISSCCAWFTALIFFLFF